MRTFRGALLFILSLPAIALALPALAQNQLQSGAYTLHYNALPSTTLSPEVARQYGITRSASRALLNISVQRRDAAGVMRAVPAAVQADATNLSGQRQALRMREVREGDAIYYLGQARVSGTDTLDFEVTVTPQEGPEMTTKFRQEFFE